MLINSDSNSNHLEDDGMFIHHAIESIQQTKDWHNLTQLIYSRLTEKLEESKIRHFADLNEYERAVIIDDIGQELKNQTSFQAFRKTCSDAILDRLVGASDASVGEHQGSILATEGAVGRAARAAASLLEFESAIEVQDRVVQESLQEDLSLRESKPGLEDSSNTSFINGKQQQSHKIKSQYRQPHASLHLLLNQSIPQPLRAQVWNRILYYPEARATFEHLVTTRRLATIASVDSEITDVCVSVLERHYDHTLSLAQRQSYVEVAKTVLSYYHTTTLAPGSTHNVLDRDTCVSLVHWIIPIIYGLDSHRSIASVVEAFLAFLRLERPRFPLQSTDLVDLERRRDTAMAFKKLFESVPAARTLYEHCTSLLGPDSLEGEVDASSSLALAAALIQPCVEHVFAATLNMECCAFLWDQCLLAGFQAIVVPASLAILILLQDHLLVCESHAALARVVQQRARFISSTSLQHVLEELFMEPLRKQLSVPLRGGSGWSLLCASTTPSSENKGDWVNTAKEELAQHSENMKRGGLDPETVKKQLSRRLEHILQQERDVDARQERSKPELPPLNLIERTLSQPGDIHNSPGQSSNKSKHVTMPNTARLANDMDQVVDVGALRKNEQKETTSTQKPDPLQIALDRISFDPKLHKLCDTTERVLQELKALSRSNEKPNKNSVQDAVLERFPALKESASDFPPVLTLGNLNKRGEKVLTICRALVPGEPETLASEIVKAEIKRLDIGPVSEDHTKKHANLLLKFSRGKTKWAPGAKQPEKKELEEKTNDNDLNAATEAPITKEKQVVENSNESDETTNPQELFRVVLQDTIQAFSTLGQKPNE